MLESVLETDRNRNRVFRGLPQPLLAQETQHYKAQSLAPIRDSHAVAIRSPLSPLNSNKNDASSTRLHSTTTDWRQWDEAAHTNESQRLQLFRNDILRHSMSNKWLDVIRQEQLRAAPEQQQHSRQAEI